MKSNSIFQLCGSYRDIDPENYDPDFDDYTAEGFPIYADIAYAKYILGVEPNDAVFLGRTHFDTTNLTIWQFFGQ